MHSSAAELTSDGLNGEEGLGKAQEEGDQLGEVSRIPSDGRIIIGNATELFFFISGGGASIGRSKHLCCYCKTGKWLCMSSATSRGNYSMKESRMGARHG